eukprot:COSAG06_NODE_3589_length_5143_cov_26.488936_2_plen_172_part_00
MHSDNAPGAPLNTNRSRRGVAANLRLAEGIVAATKSILVRVDAVCARIESADRRSADLISMSMPFPLLNSTAARQSSVAAASCMLKSLVPLDELRKRFPASAKILKRSKVALRQRVPHHWRGLVRQLRDFKKRKDREVHYPAGAYQVHTLVQLPLGDGIVSVAASGAVLPA